MRGLIKLVVILGCLIGAVLIVSHLLGKMDEAKQARAERERQAIRDREAASSQRAALIATPPEAQPEGSRITPPPINRQAEHAFRQLAERFHVEVLEYRSVGNREVVTTLRSRERSAVTDMLDRAILDDIVGNFDVNMAEDNNTMYYEQGGGVQWWQSRFTMQIEMP